MKLIVGKVCPICKNEDLEETDLVYRKYWYCYNCKRKILEKEFAETGDGEK